MNLQEFIGAATTAPSADNSQPWHFVATPETLTGRYCHRSRAPDPFGSLGHGSLISAGALHENLAQLTGTPAQEGNPVTATLSARDWSIALPVAAIGTATATPPVKALVDRHTNRLPYQTGAVNPVLPDPSGCRVTLISGRHEVAVLADALQACSEGRFNDPELHQWLFSSLRWTDEEAASGTGLDLATLHLPPGGRHFMRFIAPWERMRILNRFGIYRILAAVDATLFRQAPAIVALSGGTAPDDIWEAGRLLQRTWIALNQQGIAVHPYYAVTDLGNRLRDGRLLPAWRNKIAAAQAAAGEVLNLKPDEQIHILLRIGHPRAPAVRSRRLPPHAFLSPQ